MAHSPLPAFQTPGSIFDHSGDPKPTAPFVTGTRTQETFLPPEKKEAFANLNRTLDDPFGGTGISSILQTLLNSLIPGEEASRLSQADEFRKAGASSDASRGVAGAKLEEGFQRNRATTSAQALLQFLGPLLQGRGTALTGIPALSRSESTNFGFAPRAPAAQHIRNPTLSAQGGNEAAQSSFDALLERLNPRTFNTAPPSGGGGGGAPAPGSAGTPSSGATSFAPGSIPGFDPNQRSFSNNDLVDFQDFSQVDTEFLFGRG